ncbi:MAG: maleylpyruvate isomerase family mycothiol-dependent enzyme [Actinomycetota bacterium]
MIDEHAALKAERAAFLDTVRSLDTAEWDAESGCDGWLVRDVVSHINLNVSLKPWSAIAGIVRARGNIARFMDEASRTGRSRSIAEQIRLLERVASSARIPPTTMRSDGAIDVFVHHHDIALPLGRDVPTDPARLRWMADGLPQANRAIGAAAKVEGLRLIATDIDWHYGTGPEVRGPAAAIMLAGCGRPTLDHLLDGPGLSILQGRRG